MFKLIKFDEENQNHVQFAKDGKSVLFIHPDTSSLTYGILHHEVYKSGYTSMTIIQENDNDKRPWNYEPVQHSAHGVAFTLVEVNWDEV